MLAHVSSGDVGVCFREVRSSNVLDFGFWILDGTETERGAGGFVIPIGEIDLRVATGTATARPAQLFAVWREDGKAVKTIRGGHANGLVLACGIDDVEFEIREALEVRGEDEVVAARVEIRRPGHGFEMSDGMLVTAIRVHHEDLGLITFFVEATPADLLAIRAEERPAVVAGDVRELLHVRAVGIHDVDVHEVLLVDLQALFVLLAQLRAVGRTVAGKGNFLPVR